MMGKTVTKAISTFFENFSLFFETLSDGLKLIILIIREDRQSETADSSALLPVCEEG